MAERDLLPQSLDIFGPQLVSDIEDLYGIRSEELLRGISPEVANRIYGPRTALSPAAAAELKVDLAKTYKDLAKVSQDGNTASASDRVKLAIAAINAGAKTEAASISARAGITRMEMSGQFNLALENLKQADDALNSLGSVTSADREAAAEVANALSSVSELQEISRDLLFDVDPTGKPAALITAQDEAYNRMRQIIARDPDPDRVARITVQIASTMGTTPERVKNLMMRKSDARIDRPSNQMVREAYDGEASTSAMEAMARYERSAQEANNAIQAARTGTPGSSGSQAFLNVGLSALEPSPAGVQVDNDTLRSLGVTAEQLGDPNAAQDIQSAAQAQIENLFNAIDDAAASTPFMQQKVDAIKESARIEGSEFREFLKQSGLNPDNPAAVDVGFQLLEDEYAEIRRYETRQAKMQAEAARRLRRQQRQNERQRSAEGELAAGTVQAGPDPMMPIDQELEMMERQALQRQRQAAPAAEAPAAPDPEEADLVQRGLIIRGTPFIPLGKLEGDNTYEYAFDTSTQEFIGYEPGQDPRTGNRFNPQAIGLEQSNPRLYNSMNSTLASKAAQIQEPATQEAPTQETQGADPAVQREGIGVRRSQTENMQAIEKRLRNAARAARKRGNEESANRLEDEADRYLSLESGVTYREEEAQAQGVGTGFEQEEMLPGDERFSIGAIPEDVDQYEVPEEKQILEDLIPEDRIDPRPSPMEDVSSPMEDVPPTAKDRMQEQLNAPTDGPLSTESRIGAIEQRIEQKRGQESAQQRQERERAALLSNIGTSLGDSFRKMEEDRRKKEEIRKREEERGAVPFNPRSPIIQDATQ